jgi:hypothetical protein
MNREAWLHLMVEQLAPLFGDAGFILPAHIAVSVGFPSRGALSTKRQRIGECWYPNSSADGKTSTIFISPVLTEGVRVADVLVHELCHAVLPVDTKHKAPFAKLALQMGLVGKPTATTAGAELVERLNTLIISVGPYPHAPLTPSLVTKPQTTRLVKVACQCGYTVRVTRKWLDCGAPICPVDNTEMVEEGKAE